MPYTSSIIVQVKYLHITGGVPMTQLLPYMDMGESPSAGGQVPGTNPMHSVYQYL